MFDYEQNASLNITEESSSVRDGVTVKAITYPSPVGGKLIHADLVVPPGDGPFSAILFVHWYEPESANSNRTQFMDEALMMAREKGVISLLPETMWSEPEWYRHGRTLESDYDDVLRQVVELRRGLDVLLSQPNVDLSRVGYVGHDFGAMYGSLLIGTDNRPQVYVLIAGASNFNQWLLFGVPPEREGLAAYKAKMDALAPTRFVANAAPAPILLQFGTVDPYTPDKDRAAFYTAASEPKTLKEYPSGHAMDLPEIAADRVAFLTEKLGLK